MSDLLRSLRQGLRGLSRTPGFTLISVLTLGIGIGATSSIYSVVNAVLVRPLPFADPERLVLLQGTKKEEGKVDDWPLSFLDISDLRARSRSLTGLAAFTDPRSFNLMEEGEPERLIGEMVSSNYFDLLGVSPIQGRAFTAEEERVGSGRRVAIVSHGLWRSRLGGDPAVLDRLLLLDDESYTIVGVMPPGFRGVNGEAELWLPVSLAGEVLGTHYIQNRDFRWLSALGRLNAGVTVEQARSDLETLAANLEREFPDTNESIGVQLSRLSEALFGNLRRALLVLLGGSLFVLLIACANVVNLFLARSVMRRHEIALRSALGAGRLGAVQQLLIEGLCVALAGCVLGLLLAHWSTRLLVTAAAAEFKSFLHIGLDAWVVGITLVIALACGLCIGVIPAWMISRSDLSEDLRGTRGSGETGRRRFQAVLIVAEVALTLMLSIGTGLMVKDFRRLLETEVGFRKEGLLTLRMELKGKRFADAASRRSFVRQLAERLSSVPEAKIALAGPGIPTDDWYGVNYTIEDRHDPVDDGTVMMLRHHVTPGYFSVLGVPIIEGREFTAADDEAGMPVAVVSVEAAKHYWPGQSPIGRRLKRGARDAENPWLTIVGVAGSIKQQGLSRDERPGLDVYFSAFQFPPGSPPVLNVLVRAERGHASGLIPAIRQQVEEVASGIPLYDIVPMEERFEKQTGQRRFLVFLISLFGLVALGLSTVGIYGVISYVVHSSAKEIGIRMALGAEARDILRLVLGRGSALVLTGIALGLLAMVLLKGLLRTILLSSVSGSDPMVLVGACTLLFLVALCANWIPARRAMRVNPINTLRSD